MALRPAQTTALLGGGEGWEVALDGKVTGCESSGTGSRCGHFLGPLV